MVGGTTVGTYQLVERIGAGGMGEVWLAKHTLLGRRAAIKLLRPALSSQPDIVNRFFNEARAATTIADPGIVQIFDFGVHENGTAYIVMELLEGETLEARKRRRGRIPVEEAVRILRQVASSLGAAHARGIVHRDVKPDNIFLTRDPEVPGGERAKVLDFGIAKLLGDTQVVTQTAAIMGTPEYMSPEQCRGAGKVDERSDVYALGCVLFAAIAGRPPFQAEGGGEIIAMHLREPAPALSSLVRVDRELDELVARCLAKEPSRRFASGSELATALEQLLARVRTPTNPPPLALAATVPPTIAPTVPPTVAPSHAANVAPTVWPSAPPKVAANVAATVWPSVPPTEPPPAATVLPPSATPIAPPAPASPTTLSGSAVSAATAPKRSYNSLAIGGGAALVVAGVGVFLLARGGSGETPTAPAPAPPTTGSAASHAPSPPPAPDPAPAKPKQDLGEQAKLRILRAFAAFAQWSPAHAGAACPSAKDLSDPHGDGHDLDDPWGHPIRITCTDQPADQIIGAIVLGPDGTLGTEDDIASWTLGRDVTSFVRGARWKVSRRSSSSSSSSSSTSSSASRTPPPPPPPPPATTDIPTTRKTDPPPPAKPPEGDIPRVRK